MREPKMNRHALARRTPVRHSMGMIFDGCSLKRFFLLWAAFMLLFSGNAAAGVTGSFYMEGKNTLVDQAGRKVQVKKPFNRIISLYGAHTENLFDLGLDAQVIGVTRSDRSFEKAKGKQVFSYHDDPEKFLAARPDLVLIRPMIDRGYARLMKRLAQCGITVVSIQPKDVGEMYRYWEALGLLTGKQARAEAMISRFKGKVQAYREIASRISHKKKVYFQAMHKQMRTFTKGSMAAFVLEAAGGINIAGDGTPSRGTNIAVYGKEKILLRADEIDVFLAQYGVMNRPTIQMIKQEPGFSVIRAIKNNEIHIVDEHLVSRPTLRLLQGIHQIGNILYPDLFSPMTQVKGGV